MPAHPTEPDHHDDHHEYGRDGEDVSTPAGSALGQPPVRDVGELVRLAAVLPPDQYLREVIDLVATTLTGVDTASVTLVQDGQPRTAAATSPVAVALDDHQYATGTGPCLDAARSGLVVQIDTTATGDATGRGLATHEGFALTASRLGIRTCLSVGMPATYRTQGSLNLYSTGDGPDAAGREQASAYAAYAALALTRPAIGVPTAHLVGRLRQAMQSREVIEQAKGVLTARMSITPDEAFDHLVRLSQDTDTKLHDVAVRVVASANGASRDDDRPS